MVHLFLFTQIASPSSIELLAKTGESRVSEINNRVERRRHKATTGMEVSINGGFVE